MALRFVRRLLRGEAAGGVALILAAGLAIILANSPAARLYELLLGAHLALGIADFGVDKPVLLWINDGLMAIFFLLVGLEIKREVTGGRTIRTDAAVLPVAAALGGMAAPALIYAAAWREPGAIAGAAIPCETDIAFSLGVMALFGRRVPLSLKLFLTALAIIDDLGAILIIAIFYTGGLSWISLAAAGAALAILLALNLAGVRRIIWYVLIGIVLWLFVLKSGVHATLAGVALALAIPFAPGPDGRSPLRRVEHELSPWVAFGILPLFGFANAGLSFAGLSLTYLLGPVPLGMAAGLFLGKQIGVFGAAALLFRRGWAHLPDGASWAGLYGTSVLTGIGFTMSLFIGTLAFGESDHETPCGSACLSARCCRDCPARRCSFSEPARRRRNTQCETYPRQRGQDRMGMSEIDGRLPGRASMPAEACLRCLVRAVRISTGHWVGFAVARRSSPSPTALSSAKRPPGCPNPSRWWSRRADLVDPRRHRLFGSWPRACGPRLVSPCLSGICRTPAVPGGRDDLCQRARGAAGFRRAARPAGAFRARLPQLVLADRRHSLSSFRRWPTT